MFKILKLIVFYMIISSCTGFSDVGKVMRNEKVNTTDEFLVKKKDPLTLPPDYSDLPKPGTIKKTKDNNKEAQKIEKIFKIEKEKLSSENINQNIEKNILKKIGK